MLPAMLRVLASIFSLRFVYFYKCYPLLFRFLLLRLRTNTDDWYMEHSLRNNALGYGSLG